MVVPIRFTEVKEEGLFDRMHISTCQLRNSELESTPSPKFSGNMP